MLVKDVPGLLVHSVATRLNRTFDGNTVMRVLRVAWTRECGSRVSGKTTVMDNAVPEPEVELEARRPTDLLKHICGQQTDSRGYALTHIDIIEMGLRWTIR
jgi:hypothetical protein